MKGKERWVMRRAVSFDGVWYVACDDNPIWSKGTDRYKVGGLSIIIIIHRIRDTAFPSYIQGCHK